MAGGGDHHHVDGAHGHGGGGDFRSKVWSMPGGPNCRPKHWKRNTAIAMAGVFLLCIPIAMISVKLEVKSPAKVGLTSMFFFVWKQQRPQMPVRPIPSQLWCKNFGKKEYSSNDL